MKNSIVKKIFFSIAGIFVFIMLIQLVFQNIFLEDIYRKTKISKVENEFSQLCDDFTFGNLSEVEFIDLINDFRNDNQASIILFDNEGLVINETFFESFNSIIVRREDGVKKKILVDFLIDERGSYRNFGRKLRMEEQIEVEGVSIKGTDYIMPIVIDGSNNHFTNEEGQSFYEMYKWNRSKATIFSGVIESENFIVRDEGVFSYQHEKLLREVLNYMDDNNLMSISNSLSGEQTLNQFTEENSGLDIVTITADISGDKDKKIYAVALFTLANLHDAFVILNGYYTYIFLAQFILIVILAFLFTKKVTKPLLILISSAKSISELDFSKRTNMKSEDELSVLSDSLNSISKNLSEAMEKLEAEGERKAKNEERMRNLLTSMSHEFKTPLGIISGFLDVIKHKAYEKDPDYYLNVISEEIDKMNELVLETIQLSKFETGSYEMKEIEFNLLEFAKNVLGKFEMSIEEKNQKLLIDIDEVLVIGDIKKYEQVLYNFISNGIRYTPLGERIEIESKIFGDKVYLYIRNYGTILENEDLKRIWDQYYRTEKSRNREFGGSGLGLTIVKTILEIQDSDYGVRNIDNGVEFYFSMNIKSN